MGPGLHLLPPLPIAGLVTRPDAPFLVALPAWPAIPAENAGSRCTAPAPLCASLDVSLAALYRVRPTQEAALAATQLADPNALIATLAASAVLREQPAGALATLNASLDRHAPALQALALIHPPQNPVPQPPLEAPPASSGPPMNQQPDATGILAAAHEAAETATQQARQQAALKIDEARAKAAEIVAAARVERVTFAADRAAAQQGGKAFLLERYFANLSRALAHSPKTIIDHRLNWPEAPELDLRPPPALPGNTAR